MSCICIYIHFIYLTYNLYMSYLIRTGTGRNNIKWGGGKSTKAKYLRRTGTSRNSISWIDISSNGTYNVLERTSTGRNNIRWYNTTFNFVPTSINNFGITPGMTMVFVFVKSDGTGSSYIAEISKVYDMSFDTLIPDRVDDIRDPLMEIYPMKFTDSIKSSFSYLKRVSFQSRILKVVDIDIVESSKPLVRIWFQYEQGNYYGKRESTIVFYTS